MNRLFTIFRYLNLILLVIVTNAVFSKDKKDPGRVEFVACAKSPLAKIEACEVNRLDIKLSQSWDHFQSVVQEAGYDDAQNPEEQFFIDIRQKLIQTIEGNRKRMEQQRRCFELLNKTNQSLTSSSEIVDIYCEAFIPYFKSSLKKNFDLMQEGLNIGWSGITATSNSYSYVGLSNASDTKLGFLGIPVSEQGKNHILSNHKIETDKIKREELEEINENLYKEFEKNLLEIGFGNTNRLSDLEFINSIKHLSSASKIERIKRRVQNYSSDNIAENKKYKFAAKWRQTKEKKYQKQYFEAISEIPIVANLPNGDGKTDDVIAAFDQFIQNSNDFIERLKPGSKDPIKLKHLANFHSIIDEHLKNNLDQCGFAQTWINAKRKKESKKVRNKVVGGLALALGCIGGAIAAPTGAGAFVAAGSCGALGTGLAGYDIYQSHIERNQIIQETGLSATELLASDFEDLNEAQQELYLNIALLPSELIGAGAAFKVGKLIASRAIKGNIKNLDDLKSLKNIKDATPDEIKVISNLKDSDRIDIFEVVSRTSLNSKEKKALIDLHHLGEGFGKYTKEEITAKIRGLYRILESNGKSAPEVREITQVLLDKGIFGKAAFDPDVFVRARHNLSGANSLRGGRNLDGERLAQYTRLSNEGAEGYAGQYRATLNPAYARQAATSFVRGKDTASAKKILLEVIEEGEVPKKEIVKDLKSQLDDIRAKPKRDEIDRREIDGLKKLINSIEDKPLSRADLRSRADKLRNKKDYAGANRDYHELVERKGGLDQIIKESTNGRDVFNLVYTGLRTDSKSLTAIYRRTLKIKGDFKANEFVKDVRFKGDWKFLTKESSSSPEQRRGFLNFLKDIRQHYSDHGITPHSSVRDAIAEMEQAVSRVN